jgi:hypothetical protein
LRHTSCVVAGFTQLVHAVEVDNESAIPLWHALRAQFSTSGYWPLIVCYWCAPQPNWETLVRSETENLMSRFYFDEEVQRGLMGMSSAAANDIVRKSKEVDPLQALDACQRQSDFDPNRDAAWQIENLAREYGVAPAADTLCQQLTASAEAPSVAFQRAMFEWELSQGLRPREVREPYRYQPTEPQALLLLPIEDGFDALAHIHWFGSHTIGTPSVIALLRQWHAKYGVELMCHYGTMLELNVTRPISEPREAFAAAAQLETICMQESAREAAWQLLGASHWHMHNRP